MKVLLDNGHGSDTAGKCSPDGKIQEWKYSRKLVNRIAERLEDKGVHCVLLCPEDEDVALQARVERANRFCAADKCILVSVHLDAFGMSKKWEKARGWSVFVNTKCSEASETLGNIFAVSAEEHDMTVRRQFFNCGYWRKSLYILGKSKCPAVLTENLFMDNEKDAEILLSDEGFEKIVSLHVSSIIKYIERYGK